MFLAVKRHRFRGVDYVSGERVPCEDLSRDRINLLIGARLIREINDPPAPPQEERPAPRAKAR